MSQDESTGGGAGQYGCLLAAIGGTVSIAYFVLLVDSFTPLLVFLGYFFSAFVAIGLAAIGRNLSWTRILRVRLRVVGISLLVVSALLTLTAFGLRMRPVTLSHEERVPPDGGTVGPIHVETDGKQIDVAVEQDLEAASRRQYQRWSFVTVELLDENNRYLSSFGGELWHYGGYDDGQRWTDRNETYNATLEVPVSGTYYVRLKTETNVDSSALSPIRLTLTGQSRWGTPIPPVAGAHATFLLGLFSLLIGKKLKQELFAEHLSEGMTIRFEGREWTVQSQTSYVYENTDRSNVHLRGERWTVQPTDTTLPHPRFLEWERKHSIGSKRSTTLDGTSGGHTSIVTSTCFWSRPVPLEALSCSDDAHTTMTVAEYVEQHEALPASVHYEGTTCKPGQQQYGSLYDGRAPSGTLTRGGATVHYQMYYGPYQRSPSIMIEGTPPEDLRAVVFKSIDVDDVEAGLYD